MTLGHAGLTNQAAHKVNGATATTPAVTSVALSSRPASGDTYGAGETIAVEVGFQVPVTVTGTPRLALTIGSATRQAGYAGGSGTKTLTFQYGTQVADADADGVSIGASALTLNGGTIRSAAAADAGLGLGAHALTNQAAHKVNGAATAPTVSSVAVSSSPASGDTYGRGETIRVGVEFLFAVTVTGSPRLALTIGSATRQASYAGGSGTRTLTFAYVAQQADVDADGLGVGTGALTLNGGTIRSATATDAALGLGSHAITAATGHKVNGGDGDAGDGGVGDDREQPGERGHVRGGGADRGGGGVHHSRHPGAGQSATGVDDRERYGAGGVSERGPGADVDVRVRGAVRGRGRGRAEHRGGRAGPQRRLADHELRGLGDVGVGDAHARECGGPQGERSDGDDAGGDLGGARGRAAERGHVRRVLADHGGRGVPDPRGGDGESAVGADVRERGRRRRAT